MAGLDYSRIYPLNKMKVTDTDLIALVDGAIDPAGAGLVAAVDAALDGTAAGMIAEVDIALDGTSAGMIAEVDNALDGTAAGFIAAVVAALVVGDDYAPTLTDVTNVAASALIDARYQRIGPVVTVFFSVTIDATGTGALELGIDLPVASNFAAAGDCIGMAVSAEADEDQALIDADLDDDRASLQFVAVATGVVTWNGSFSYIVI